MSSHLTGATASSGGGIGSNLGGMTGNMFANNMIASTLSMSPTLLRAVGVEGANDIEECPDATSPVRADAADATDVGPNIRSGESTEHRVESASTYSDQSSAVGTNAAMDKPVDNGTTELHAQAAGNVGSPFASANRSDLVAAGTRFNRPIPEACLDCPACNGKHRSHTCNVPQNERPGKQDRLVVEKKSNVTDAELRSFDHPTQSAQQDMSSRSGRQRKRKVPWEPKPDEKRAVHSRPQPRQQSAVGRSGGASSITNTAWLENVRTGGGAAGPRAANSANTGLSRTGGISGGGAKKPVKKRNYKKKAPPAYGPVPDLCSHENIGQRVATYWDIDRVSCIALCCVCHNFCAPRFGGMLLCFAFAAVLLIVRGECRRGTKASFGRVMSRRKISQFSTTTVKS
eukprot:COSAG02_NODE_7_length_64539_cov_120.393482_42_plen_401_part_00